MGTACSRGRTRRSSWSKGGTLDFAQTVAGVRASAARIRPGPDFTRFRPFRELSLLVALRPRSYEWLPVQLLWSIIELCIRLFVFGRGLRGQYLQNRHVRKRLRQKHCTGVRAL